VVISEMSTQCYISHHLESYVSTVLVILNYILCRFLGEGMKFLLDRRRFMHCKHDCYSRGFLGLCSVYATEFWALSLDRYHNVTETDNIYEPLNR